MLHRVHISNQPETINSLRLGNDQFKAHPCNGCLKDFRIWTRVLTVDEISSRMNTELTGKEPGLHFWLPLKFSTKIIDHVSGKVGRTRNCYWTRGRSLNTTVENSVAKELVTLPHGFVTKTVDEEEVMEFREGAVQPLESNVVC